MGSLGCQVQEQIMPTLTTNPQQTAGTSGSPDRPVYAVVGFDGSASSRHALDTAARLLTGRAGGMEIVYVAHLPAMALAASTGATVSAEVLESLDDATRDLSEQARAHLQAAGLRGAAQNWHFLRRNGAIADNLIAVADEIRGRHGPDATVVLIVGRSEHGYHHVLGSVPRALERHIHYPVMIIP
jgi:nucleotide-binding universal stress UspA family protein